MCRRTSRLDERVSNSRTQQYNDDIYANDRTPTRRTPIYPDDDPVYDTDPVYTRRRGYGYGGFRERRADMLDYRYNRACRYGCNYDCGHGYGYGYGNGNGIGGFGHGWQQRTLLGALVGGGIDMFRHPKDKKKERAQRGVDGPAVASSSSSSSMSGAIGRERGVRGDGSDEEDDEYCSSDDGRRGTVQGKAREAREDRDRGRRGEEDVPPTYNDAVRASRGGERR